MAGNVLYYGDNLYWLRRMKDETVDLIYLDPPFNSNRNYNVLFKDERGTESEAQIIAFEDTWHWNQATEAAYAELVQDAPSNVVHMIAAMRQFIGANQMMAYLVMMTVRLVELRRVLKPTGSLYLHCDPTASHYLKILMDTIFDPRNFRNEIVWKRRRGSSSQVHIGNKFGACTDTILFYVKSEEAVFQPQYNMNAPGYQEYIENHFTHIDENGRRFQIDNLANPAPRPNLMYEYKGYKPPANGWAISREKMTQWDQEGRLWFPPSKEGRIRRKRFLDELKGDPVQSLWDDIEPLSSQSGERLGYPTQKPLALLERIISASSNPGDVVLDPFCGCGTAITAAQKLGRQWIGIDITHLSIALMKYRLEAMFPGIQYKVDGEPKDMGAARKLAQDDRYQFQYWACSLVRAKPLGGQVGSRSGKKGSDRGVDGLIDFEDDASGALKKIVVQVKSGHVQSHDIRDLVGTIQREQAEMGVFLTLEEPTREMRTEAATAGFYTSHWGRHPRIQIYTIEELLREEKRVDMPPQAQVSRTFKRAERAQATSAIGQLSLTDSLTASASVAAPPLTEAEDEALDDELDDEEAE